MVISATATATSAPATSSTSTIEPRRRNGSCAATGSGVGSRSIWAFMAAKAALRSFTRFSTRGFLSALIGPESARASGPYLTSLRAFWPLCGRGSRHPPSRKAALQTHDVADDLGDRMVVLDRNLLVDLDGGIERARQRHVLYDRDVVLAGDLPDLEGDVIDTLGDADRRRHAAVVLQGDRIVGR